MAKFLNTRKTVSEIDELMRNAGEKLFLVSPYLKLSKDFKELLKHRNDLDKVTHIIFRKQELNPDDMKFLQGLRFVVLKYYEDLHAKCYASDTKMVITSMNLYEFSMANNKEMGILIDKLDSHDETLFNDALNEIEFINRNSQKFELTVTKEKRVEETANREYKPKRKSEKNTGYCIRTGVEIPFNIEKPLCYDAYKSWVEYGDEDYPEKYCHFSGAKSYGQTSVSRPILRQYWEEAKEKYSL